MRSRARLLALLASVLLHAALLLAVARFRGPGAPAQQGETIEIAVQYVAPPPPEPALANRAQPEPGQAAPRAPAARPREQVRAMPQASVPREPAEEVAGGGGQGEAGASAGSGPASEDRGGSPASGQTGQGTDAREVDLSIHSGTGTLAMGSGGGGRGLGETWRNEPGGFPDPEAQRAAGAAEGKRNVDGWLADGLAVARARNGVDPYFSELGQALEKQAALDSNRLLSGDPAKDLMTAYQDGASRYSRTGNPYAAGAQPGSAPQIDGDTPLNRNAAQFQGSGMQRGQALFGNGVGPDAMRQKLEMGRSLRDFAEGRFGDGLLAIVELRQGRSGELLQLTLTQPSGNAAFDAHVLRAAPAAVGALGPPPEKGQGIHPEGLRSTWSFEGRIVYQRKLSDMSLLKDGWYVALLSAAGLATGTFDETTGEAEMPDFRHPEFKLKVKLLKVY